MRILAKSMCHFFVCCLSILVLPGVVAADSSKHDMIQFVKEAKKFALEVGRDEALAEFSKKDGKFFRDDLYIFAYDFEGTVVAHGAKPHLVGRNLLPLKDAVGLEVIKSLVNAAKGGEGFVEYHWEHPTQKRVMPKLGYVVKVDDNYWIGSGIYVDLDKLGK